MARSPRWWMTNWPWSRWSCLAKKGPVELDPGRVRPPAVAHDEVADAAEELRSRQLVVGAGGGITRRDRLVAPQELEDGDRPLLRHPAALALDPCRVGVLEAVDGVGEDDVVQRLQ